MGVDSATVCEASCCFFFSSLPHSSISNDDGEHRKRRKKPAKQSPTAKNEQNKMQQMTHKARLSTTKKRSTFFVHRLFLNIFSPKNTWLEVKKICDARGETGWLPKIIVILCVCVSCVCFLCGVWKRLRAHIHMKFNWVYVNWMECWLRAKCTFWSIHDHALRDRAYLLLRIHVYFPLIENFEKNNSEQKREVKQNSEQQRNEKPSMAIFFFGVWEVRALLWKCTTKTKLQPVTSIPFNCSLFRSINIWLLN